MIFRISLLLIYIYIIIYRLVPWRVRFEPTTFEGTPSPSLVESSPSPGYPYGFGSKSSPKLAVLEAHDLGPFQKLAELERKWDPQKFQGNLGWWWQLKDFLCSSRKLWKWSNLTHIFANGLKPPGWCDIIPFGQRLWLVNIYTPSGYVLVVMVFYPNMYVAFLTPVHSYLHPRNLTSPMKMNGWKTIVSFWISAYFQGLLTSGCIYYMYEHPWTEGVWTAKLYPFGTPWRIHL